MKTLRFIVAVGLYMSTTLTAQTQNLAGSMAADAPTVFEVATVKLSSPDMPTVIKLFTVKGREVLTLNTTTADLITFAYGVQTRQVSGGPSWIENDRFGGTT